MKYYSSQGKEKQDHSVKDTMIVEDEPELVEQMRRIGRAGFKGTCYRCGEGHKSFECPNVGKKVDDRRVVVTWRMRSRWKISCWLGEYCFVRRC